MAANHLGIRLQILEVRSADELEGAFRAAIKEHADALIQTPDNLFTTQRREIVDLEKKNRLPAICSSAPLFMWTRF
jgi:ABC-type uncharacterized transport system substrate-binding protein